jgi:hypothetical protein
MEKSAVREKKCVYKFKQNDGGNVIAESVFVGFNMLEQ